MAKFLKIIIFVFLALFVSAGFGIFHFSNAQNSQNNVSETRTSNQDLISLQDPNSSAEGTVYLCPEATSLEEINPRCPNKVVLKLGETIDGLTLTTTVYENQEYYMVLGFENGGGAVNLPPVADANGPYEGYAGLPITFDASSSTDPNNDPLEYRWDFDNDEIWDTNWLSIPTVNHIWNNDYESIVRLEVSDGEFTVIATTSVKVKSARTFKEETINKLTSAKTGNKKIDQKIDKIIWLINQSLNEVLWIDASRLVFFEKGEWNDFDFDELKEEEFDFDLNGKVKGPKAGILVFHYEKVAVRLIMPKPKFNEEFEIPDFIEDSELTENFGGDFRNWKTPKELKPVFEKVISKLVKADILLAKVSIYDAKNTPVQNPKFQKIVLHHIQKAEQALNKSYQELDKNRPDKAIKRLEQAWHHAQLAIKFATLKE